MVLPVPFCQCSVAQEQLLELARSSGLRWCLPSVLGSQHIPWDGGSSSVDPALPTRSWSCQEDAPRAGVSPHRAGTWGFLSSWIPQLQLPGEGNAWQGRPGMAGDIPGWGEGAPLQPREKTLRLRVFMRGLEEPPGVKGELVAGNTWQS